MNCKKKIFLTANKKKINKLKKLKKLIQTRNVSNEKFYSEINF